MNDPPFRCSEQDGNIAPERRSAAPCECSPSGATEERRYVIFAAAGSSGRVARTCPIGAQESCCTPKKPSGDSQAIINSGDGAPVSDDCGDFDRARPDPWRPRRQDDSAVASFPSWGSTLKGNRTSLGILTLPMLPTVQGISSCQSRNCIVRDTWYARADAAARLAGAWEGHRARCHQTTARVS
jgi:hypothetical protein